ncbi:type VI secretion system baseplate subunit TssE [Microvirga sp. 0TCS3.31]
MKLDLRDEAGERIIASRRSSQRGAISEPVLKREVARDLEALMNTIAVESSLDMTGCDNARNSILNFGLPDIVKRSVDDAALDIIAGEIRTALINFEPRLVAKSISVTRDRTANLENLKARFRIQADLLCNPANVPVEFIADVELDIGRIAISRG